jgi:hypothetical protein
MLDGKTHPNYCHQNYGQISALDRICLGSDENKLFETSELSTDLDRSRSTPYSHSIVAGGLPDMS